MSAGLYGMVASFDGPDALLAAIARLRAAGYRRLEAFTPFPVEGLDAALALRPDAMPLVMLIGGIVGGFAAFAGQTWTTVGYWRLNVGGRPNFSWPAYIPITFELTILGAALAGFVGLMWLNGLPRLHHPVFDAPHFDLASRDRFFLCVRAHDAAFDAELTRRTLERLGAKEVSVVRR